MRRRRARPDYIVCMFTCMVRLPTVAAPLDRTHCNGLHCEPHDARYMDCAQPAQTLFRSAVSQPARGELLWALPGCCRCRAQAHATCISSAVSAYHALHALPHNIGTLLPQVLWTVTLHNQCTVAYAKPSVQPLLGGKRQAVTHLGTTLG